MAPRIVPFLLALTLATPAAAQSANRIASDSPDVDGSRLRPGEWTMRYMRKTDGQERQVGEVRYQLTRTTVDGRAAFQAVQTIRAPAGSFADTAIFLQASLRPVSHRSHNSNRTLNLRFDGTRVEGSVTPAEGESQDIAHTMTVPAFDANILDLIFGALPLEKGYSGTLLAYMYEAAGPIEVSFDVVGNTVVEAGGEKRDAWALDVNYPMGHGRFWVDRSTHEPLGAEIVAQDGSTTRIVR